MPSYLKYAFLKNLVKKPVYLIFFVTDRCNSKCLHCFNFASLNRGAHILSLAEVDAFSKQLDHVEWLALSGGEPLIREDVAEVVETFFRNNGLSQITIPTNALLPDLIYKQMKKIVDISPSLSVSLNLSLDGLGDNHDFIRGVKGNYQKLLQTYRRVLPLKQYGNFSLRANTTITNFNYHEIEQLSDAVMREMPELDSHNFEFMRGDAPDKRFSPPPTEKIPEITNTLIKILKRYQFFRKSKLKSRMVLAAKKTLYQQDYKTLVEKRRTISCYAGKTHAVLDEVGNLYFCELFPKIGNIRGHSFEEVWHGEEAEKQREIIENKKCYCTHACFQNSNIVFSPSQYPKLLLNAL